MNQLADLNTRSSVGMSAFYYILLHNSLYLGCELKNL